MIIRVPLGVIVLLLSFSLGFSQEQQEAVSDTSTLNLAIEDSVTQTPTLVDTTQSPENSSEMTKGKRALQIILGTVSASFIGLGYYYNQEGNLRYNKYLALPEGEERDAAYDEVQSADRARNTFYILSGGAAIGLTLTFVF